ncbi:hypothetical protein [Pseudobacteroides cellulosolvens]|uniref:hypothetical protein n=1 Tax=Pseudobacteroides cellulosolvens TaxID=35825 RepID=UPI0009DF1BDD|nr:hypothetical protein [Pseudobacteroides cellulosolvens]
MNKVWEIPLLAQSNVKRRVQDRIVKNKMSLLELAEYLQNHSEACGVSRQHFYDIKTSLRWGA